MTDDLLGVLTRFHREVVLPDIERIVDDRLEATIGALREDMLSNFDALYKRMDRLDSEYHALTAAVGRLEERMRSMEQKLDRAALQSEVLGLKERVIALEQRIAEIEAEL